MAKDSGNGETLRSYIIKGINKSIRPGDCVFMRSPDPDKPSYIAKVDKIESTGKGRNVKFHIRWYYRPGDTIHGKQPFHGSKEVFLSDHRDIQSADTIEGKCNVHTLRSYTKLDPVGADDYFCRLEYSSITGGFNPTSIGVFCKCQLPYNPDKLMIQCEKCKDWFHPKCVGMTVNKAKQVEHFFCKNCSSEEQNTLQNSHNAISGPSTMKVDKKRLRR